MAEEEAIVCMVGETSFRKRYGGGFRGGAGVGPIVLTLFEKCRG